MDSWRHLPIKELGRVVTGATPKAAETDSWGDEVDFVTPTDQREGARDITAARRLSAAGAERLNGRLIPPGSTCFTCIGATIGKVSLTTRPSVTNQQINSVVPYENVADSEFLYYLLKASASRIAQIASGSATPIVNKRQFEEFRVRVPDLMTQMRIGRLLGALDDKIAVNDQIAKVSDELIRQHYARVSGQAHDVIRIGDIAVRIRDMVPGGSLSADEKYIGLEHMPRRNVWLAQWGSAGAVTSTKTRFSRGDLLFGKLRPYFRKIGTAFADGVSSTDILVIRPVRGSFRGWLLAALSSDEVVAHACAVGDGTRMPRVSWADLASYRIPWAGEERAALFNELVAVLFGRVGSAIAENRTLAELRDTLLPELMSAGEDLCQRPRRRTSRARSRRPGCTPCCGRPPTSYAAR
jgi:type I restriction enzyme, S subunit